MRIHTKLSWTFTLLIVLGVTSISSYSIWFIREFLVQDGRSRLQQEALLYAGSLAGGLDRMPLPGDSATTVFIVGADGHWLRRLRHNGVQTAAQESGPRWLGIPAATRLVDDEPHDRIWVDVPVQTLPNVAAIRVERIRSELYAPIRVIRWIIYSGMAISILIVVLVSRVFARNLTRPILALTATARAVAEGETQTRVNLSRKDEFGELAYSINQMANTLTDDNRRLERLNQELQLAHTQQAQFYADITHEIRTPLHVLQGNLELLELTLQQPDNQRNAQQALHQTERLNRLFNDLLTLQRADADPNFVQLRPTHVLTIAQRAAEAYERDLKQRGIALVWAVPTELMVLGDPTRLEQVLDNLVSNATKYTTKGHIRIAAKTTGKEVTISVEDTGQGIAAEHIPQLTERFYRTDSSRARDAEGIGGTGLGLAVVARILAAHGSELHIQSTVGVGSCFSFRLPLAS